MTDPKINYYSGIGSRSTPREIIDVMIISAKRLANAGYVLRSGGCDGADVAFERGCDLVQGQKQIFIPWKRFNNSDSPLHNIPDGAFKIASELHPYWKRLGEPVKKLMARNVLQVLGETLDQPVEFVICYTPDGCISGKDRSKETGGTGQAIELASSLGIPVYNLQREFDRELVNELIDRLV